MIALLLERLARVAGRDDIVVATSARADDDALAQWCAEHDVACFRGDLDDVAGRMVAAASAHGFDALVRVCADSPFLDPGLVRQAVDAYRAHGPDLVTNIYPRRAWPKGQSVEVIRRSVLERAHAEMDAGDREHVTPYFYRHAERFRIVPLEATVDRSDASLVVDTPEDLAEAERVVERAPRAIRDCTLDELLQLRALLR
jgi:spore coat polysaccharide biosynthesis protein SpsF